MFNRLYHFYLLFKEYFLLTALLSISILMMLLNDNSQVHRFRAYSIAIGGVLQNSLSFIPKYYSLKSENDLLRQINVNLADEVNYLRESSLENSRLKNLLSFKDSIKTQIISAKVVSSNLNLLRNTITINKGTLQNIKIGNPVISGEGLVGKVINSSENYSLVQLILNVDFKVSAKDQRSRIDGIISWNGKKLLMNNVTQTLDVKPGDAIITSEYSNSFPSGLKIGVVQKTKILDEDLFQEIHLSPSVNFTNLEEVFVMDYVPDLERIGLEKQ